MANVVTRQTAEMNMLRLLALAILVCLQDVSAQIVRVSDSSRVRVDLACGATSMNVRLTFTGVASFNDWIVVGNTGEQNCRTQGSGKTEYSLFIPLMGGQTCGTILKNSGVFENSISVRQNPFLILGSDEQIILRCEYGSPIIGTPNIPQTNGFIGPGALLPTSPFPAFPQQQYPATEATIREAGGIPIAYIYLIVFLILFLALLFLLCGCLYYFLKRRKVRVERRKKLLLAVPAGSELGKMGLGGLWWPGKQVHHQDALLSHDYMVSSNSTRGPLSVSTDYNESATPSTSSDSPEARTTSYHNQVFVHEAKHMIPRAHADPRQLAQSTGHLQTITEERQSEAVTSPKSYLEWKKEIKSEQKTVIDTISADVPYGPVYSQIDLSKKSHRSNEQIPQHGSVDLDVVQKSISRFPPSEMRSVSEIATLPPLELNNLDTASISTLEGRQYFNPKELEHSPPGVHTVHVDVHHRYFPTANSQKTQPIDVAVLETFIHAVEQHRGPGPNTLTEAEVGRWKTVLTTDQQMQQMIQGAKTLEDFELISHHPNYQNMYSGEKWALIVQSLAHVAFMRKLSDILDQDGSNLPPPPPEMYGSHSSYLSKDSAAVHTPSPPPPPPLPTSMPPPLPDSALKQRKYLKKFESDQGSRRSANDLTNIPGDPELHLQNTSNERRLFTRESYYRIKSDMESVSGDEDSKKIDMNLRKIPQNSDFNRDRSTWEVIETVPAVSSRAPNQPLVTGSVNSQRSFRDRSSSETFENPPTLSVYVGNMPERSINNSVKNAAGREGFYQSAGSMSDLSHPRSMSELRLEEKSSIM